MPRALPWTTDGAAKAGKVAVKKEKTVVREQNHAASGDDLVNSDLDAVRTKTPEKKEPKKKRIRASSSSPPPPGPPPVESIKPGFAADDIYMMVEDEFYSGAACLSTRAELAVLAELVGTPASKSSSSVSLSSSAADVLDILGLSRVPENRP